MASTSSSASINHEGEKFKLKPENFPTYQSHLSSFHSSTSTPDYKHDVFICFRGEDTRNTFTGHLHRALVANNIAAFKDDEELDRGKQISPELLQAIKDSRFSMVVFSKNFATSRWCLDELVHILECMKPGKSIIPIFYDVDPSVIRHQSGTYATAFAEHQKKYPEDRVNKWKFGLSAVANISGWHLNHGIEAEFIQKIVQDVSCKLTETFDGSTGEINHQFQLDGTDSVVDNELDGTDSVVDDELNGTDSIVDDDGTDSVVDDELDGTDSVVDDELDGTDSDVDDELDGTDSNVDDELEYDVFLSSNIGEDSVMNFTNDLYTALNSKGIITFKDNEECDEGKHMSPELLQTIKGSRLIIIILSKNYVASNWCLDLLVYILECTRTSETRKFLPIFYNVSSSEVRCQTNSYEKAFTEHEENYKHDLEKVLKWRSALTKVGSLSDWDLNDGCEQELITNIVRHITCRLSKRVKRNYKFQQLVGIDSRVKQIPNRAMHDVLRVSFDSLDDELKDMFLYIACFFNGKKVNRVLEILDCCGFHPRIGMSILIDKSLVTISNNILCMHKQAQQMGLEIVRQKCPREPGERSRLWHHADRNEAMRRNLGTNHVEAMVLDQPELERNWNFEAFKRLCNLRLLYIRSKVHLPEGLEYLPGINLRYLKWRGYPSKYFPINLDPSNLVELNMCHGQIKQLWRGEMFFPNLKFIKLSHSENLIKTPNFTRVPNLERLVLEGCSNLVEVHPSIGILKDLRFLNLRSCSSVRSLPHFISTGSLEICVLSGCSRLDEFHMDGNMRNLSQLYLDGTIFLHFDGLLPYNRENWNNLACLLPKIPNIKKLSLRNCDLPEGSIPNDLGYLTSLEILDLGRNKFISLPTSISQLVKLKFLGLAHCNLLQSLPELPSNIEYVEARDCSSLVTFSNAFKVRTSTDLVLSFINCYKLKQNQDRKSTMITLLKAYIQSLLKIQNQELSHLGGRFDVVIPGSRVPEWFNHQNMGPSVRIHLPPKWSNDSWIGFAFCVVFGVHENVPDDEDGQLESENSQEITCQLYTNVGPISTGFGFNISRGTLVVSSHLWVHYISNGSFRERMAKWKRTSYIDASFEMESHRLEVKKCGFRVVYKQDVEETSKRNLQYIFPPTEDLALGFFSFDT